MKRDQHRLCWKLAMRSVQVFVAACLLSGCDFSTGNTVGKFKSAAQEVSDPNPNEVKPSPTPTPTPSPIVPGYGSFCLDPKFGNAGKVSTALSGQEELAAVQVQADGKIVAAGFASDSGTTSILVVRYETAGGLDTSFGNGGKAIVSVNSEAKAKALTVQADGSILVAGSTFNGTNYDFLVVKLLGSGVVDNSFGTSGKAILDFQANDQAAAIAVSPSGTVIAGTAVSATSSQFAVALLDRNGQLQTNFGVAHTGLVLSAFPDEAEAKAVAFDSSGRILVAGKAYNGSKKYDFALVRIKPNGDLDNQFGDVVAGGSRSGKTLSDLGGNDEANSLSITADNKILVTGSSYSLTTRQDLAIARFDATGTLDSTFGTNGKVVRDLGRSDEEEGLASTIDSNGNILVAGTTFNGNYRLFLGRFSSTGILTSASQLAIDFSGSQTLAQAIALTREGKIILAGKTSPQLGISNLALARFLP